MWSISGLALDAEKILETNNAIISGRQRAPDEGEPLAIERFLFAGIDHDHGLPVGQLGQRL
jgi:hypothetical protein